MSDAISPILQWLNAHPNLGGIVTFLITAAESFAIIGTIVPGTVTMTAIGILVGSGVLPLWSTLIWGSCGAFFGDTVSFLIGYHFKHRLVYMWPFKKYPQLLENGEHFFKRYGRMSVIVGKFVGPTRAIVPVVAGMLNMKPWRFIITSAIASVGWAPIYMLPGILVGGAALELPPDIAVQMIMVLLLAGLVIILCVWLLYKLLFLIRNQINHFLNSVWNRLQHSKYFHGVTTILQHHKVENLHGQLTLAFYFFATLLLYLYIFTYITLHNAATIKINHLFFYLFSSLHSPVRDDIMLWFTNLGDKKILLPVMAGIIFWLSYKKCWRSAWHAIGAIIITCVCITLFKHLAHEPRPWGLATPLKDFSFPSGHTTFSTLFYMGLVLLFTQTTNLKTAKPLYFLMGFVIASIGISRMYLGAHWFTDVLGGLLLSSAILIAIVISYNRKKEHHLIPQGIFAYALAATIIFSGIFYWSNTAKLHAQYAPASWPVYHITSSDWWEQKGDHLPVYRIGRFGLPNEVLNVEWIGNIDVIKKELLTAGWAEPPDRDWISIIHRLSGVGSTDHLPLVSPLYLNKKPKLQLIKFIDKKLLVLRLWDSNLILDDVKNSHYQLWVGTLGLVPRTYSWLIHYKNNYAISPELLFTNKNPHYEIKQIIVVSPKKNKRLQNVILIKPKKRNP